MGGRDLPMLLVVLPPREPILSKLLTPLGILLPMEDRTFCTGFKVLLTDSGRRLFTILEGFRNLPTSGRTLNVLVMLPCISLNKLFILLGKTPDIILIMLNVPFLILLTRLKTSFIIGTLSNINEGIVDKIF